MRDLNRRDFVKTTAALLGAAALPTLPSVATAANPTAGAKELRVLQIGVGGIGKMDRNGIKDHPKAKIVGLCDVDKGTLNKLAKNEFPEAIVETDWRKFFSGHLDQFDAVNVCTPDHHHAVQMLTALAHDKHLYAQKPVVQQLEELVMMEQALEAKPHLATQTGNQRMQNEGRRVAVQILEKGLLGPAIEAWLWTSSNRGSIEAQPLPEATPPHPNLDWDLWLGPAAEQPHRPGIAPKSWRNWWDFGTGAMGDWGVHLFDVVMYSYPELTSPVAVRNDAPRVADWLHVTNCQAVLTYEVNSPRFTGKTFPLHFADNAQIPDVSKLGVDPAKTPDKNATLVRCEGGTLLLTANGKLDIYQGGKHVDWRKLEGVQRLGEVHHWHSWIDQALGDKNAEVWTPVQQGLRMTEASILPGKASKFPGKELLWDKKTLSFTNSQEATDTVVRRLNYRDGFAPPKVKA